MRTAAYYRRRDLARLTVGVAGLVLQAAAILACCYGAILLVAVAADVVAAW